VYFYFFRAAVLMMIHPQYTGETGTFRVSVIIPDQHSARSGNQDHEFTNRTHSRARGGYGFSNTTDSRVIPAGYKWLKVTITTEAQGTLSPQQTDISGGGATLTVNDVPVGINSALIQILDEGNNILAQRKHGFYMGPGGTASAGTVENPLHMGVAITGNSGGKNTYQPATIEFLEETILYYENWDSSAQSVTFRCGTYSTDAIAPPTSQTQPTGHVEYDAKSISFGTGSAGTYYYYPVGDDSAYVNVISPITTGTVSGIVTDAETGATLSGVQVNVGTSSYVTGSNGVYTILLVPPGNHTITAKKHGYESYTGSVTVEIKQTTNLNIQMHPDFADVEREWIWQNPMPQGQFEYINSSFVNENVGWMIATDWDMNKKGSYIVYTRDGGQSWIVQKYCSESILWGIHFIDENEGWVVGENKTMLYTNNGGLTWTDRSHAQVTQTSLYDVCFVDSLYGWIVGDGSGSIYRTTDGGNSWQIASVGGTGTNFSISFANRLNGIIGANNSLRYTTDGGDTWGTTSITSGRQVFSVYLHSDGQTGFAAVDDWSANKGYIYKTIDGGATWDTPIEFNERLFFISFADAQNGWASGRNGLVLRTTNGGTTWNPVTAGGSGDTYYTCHAFSSSSALLGSLGGKILKTTNSGTNWTNISDATTTSTDLTTKNLNGIHFVNDTHGWAVGNNGKIIHSPDGGNNWTEQASGSSTHNMTGVHFSSINPLRGAVTAGVTNDRIFYTNNGGNNWSSFATETGRTVNTIYMVSDTLAFAAGYTGSTGSSPNRRGNLYRATNAGSGTPENASWTWQWVVFGNSEASRNKTIRSIDFYNTQNGCVVGDSGFTAYTIDGATSWSNVVISGNLKGVSYLDSNTILAVGDSGTIYRSLNAGASWSLISSPVIGATNLRSVSAADSNSAWAVGDNGKIFYTSDRGTTWRSSSSCTTNHLKSVHFVSSARGWAAGDSGNIIHHLRPNYEVTGTVTRSDTSAPVENVLVSIGGVSDITGADGKYTLRGVAPPAGSKSIGAKRIGFDTYANSVTTVLNSSVTHNISLDVQNRWHWQNPKFTSAILHCAYFTDPLNGWITGEMGALFRTVDGGNRWAHVYESAGEDVGIANTFQKVSAVKPGKGWTAGSAGHVFRTTDNGVNLQKVGITTTNNVNDVHFIDEKKGWAVTNGAHVYHTNNGGINWTMQSTGAAGALNGIYMTGPTHGVACGASARVVRTTDGLTWTSQTLPDTTVALLDVFFVNSQIGWIVGGGGWIFKTTDGGATWTAQRNGGANWTGIALRGVYFVTPEIGWVCGGNVVLKTINGGTTWTNLTTGTSEIVFYGLNFINENVGWLVGSRGETLKTTNGGTTWTPVNTTTAHADVGHFWGISFCDANNGLAVGNSGRVFKTTNGGKNWEQVNSGVSVDLNDVFYISSTTAVAVGGAQNIIRTTNSGDTWALVHEGSGSLTDVHFPDSNNGWAVGTAGALRRSSNGGGTWTPFSHTPITPTNYWGVHFISSTTGWIVGDGGLVCRTTNGTATTPSWTTQTSNTTADLKGVHFINSNTGWAVGSGATVIRTTNGGSNWTASTISGAGVLWDVWFSDANNGWCAGANGKIYRTTDGGVNWTLIETYTRKDLFSLSFVDANNGWVSGQHMTILNYPKPR
jgi:photosystem II stability/assembly factor-like uncharacterized protein